ncbi:MAG: ABC transporter substrate-binding protein [Desulfobulbaceae bacterium]|nr:ABC transporter substrate-binding protein [Desulfobulbaceae bacterium]
MRILYFFMGLLIFCTVGAPDVIAQKKQYPEPKEQLLPFVDRVLEVLVDKELQGAEKKIERRQKIMDLAQERFDFVEFSRLVLPDDQWKALSGGERDHFVSLFKKLLEFAYINKLEGYGDQKVVFVKQRFNKTRAVVHTKLIDEKSEEQVIYLMILRDNGWMIFDIVLQGTKDEKKVSILKNYRAQFKEIIANEQYSGLLKQLEERVADLEKKS